VHLLLHFFFPFPTPRRSFQLPIWPHKIPLSQAGPLLDIRIPSSQKGSGRPLYAFVKYEDPASAAYALSLLGNNPKVLLFNRPLTVRMQGANAFTTLPGSNNNVVSAGGNGSMHGGAEGTARGTGMEGAPPSTSAAAAPPATAASSYPSQQWLNAPHPAAQAPPPQHAYPQGPPTEAGGDPYYYQPREGDPSAPYYPPYPPYPHPQYQHQQHPQQQQQWHDDYYYARHDEYTRGSGGGGASHPPSYQDYGAPEEGEYTPYEQGQGPGYFYQQQPPPAEYRHPPPQGGREAYGGGGGGGGPPSRLRAAGPPVNYGRQGYY
jgi:hypothetical protein